MDKVPDPSARPDPAAHHRIGDDKGEGGQRDIPADKVETGQAGDGGAAESLTGGRAHDALSVRIPVKEGESMSDKQSGEKKPGEWAPDTAPSDAPGVGSKGDAPADSGPPPGKK